MFLGWLVSHFLRYHKYVLETTCLGKQPHRLPHIFGLWLAPHVTVYIFWSHIDPEPVTYVILPRLQSVLLWSSAFVLRTRVCGGVRALYVNWSARSSLSFFRALVGLLFSSFEG